MPKAHRPILFILTAALAACSGASQRTASPPDSVAPMNAALRDDLLRMGLLDQTARLGMTVGNMADTTYLRATLVIDSILSRRLRRIVEQHGWPTRSAVGPDAAGYAFLILQHSPSDGFQRRSLPLLEAAAQKDEAAASDVALLTDRLRTHDGLPQIFGTQFRIVDGELVPFPIDRLDSLDARRDRAGLMPMSDYVKLLQQNYQGTVRWPPR
jgi:hypothetical protein